jgi:hypothetical protein
MNDICPTPADRDKWLQALQDFGRPPDVAKEYAAHLEQTRVMREVLVGSGRKERLLFVSNDNDSNYSADMLHFPAPSDGL